MTLSIAIGLSFYNDYDSLKRMIDSCQQYPIDKIVAIDGRYQGYPSKQQYSNKECLELLTASKVPVAYFEMADVDQRLKRQAYFDACNTDCLIVMDSDEYFLPDKTDWPLFIEDLQAKITDNAHTFRQAYCIPVTLGDKGIQQMPAGYTEYLPRLFHKPNIVRYVDDHFTIRNKKTGVLMTYEGNSVLQHIAMGHDHALRTKKYSENTRIYEENLIKDEDLTRQQKQDDFIRSIQRSS